jgi:hypothetical protein
MNKLLFFALIILVGCGKSTNETANVISSSIIDGEKITSQDLASQSSVALTAWDSKTADCSGTIISENLIVTAGHCVTFWTEKKLFKKSKQEVYIDNKFITFKLNDSKDQINLPIESAEAYPMTADNAGYGDVAVVKISGKIPQGFKPVSILAPEYTLIRGTDLLLAGFGATYPGAGGFMDKRKRPIASYQVRMPFDLTEGKVLYITQPTGKRGATHGDSGGAAYLETDNELLLAGSTIGGPDDGDVAYYIHLGEYKDFILNAAKKLKGISPVFKMPNE